MFGSILPYKQFHNIIINWKSKTKLLIAGSSPSKKYLNYLIKLKKDKNIIIEPYFQTHQEMARLFTTAKALILPQVNPSCRVSGNLYMALSYGAPVMALKGSFTDSVMQFHNLENILLFESVEKLCLSVSNELDVFNLSSKTKNIKALSDKKIKSYFKKYLEFTN